MLQFIHQDSFAKLDGAPYPPSTSIRTECQTVYLSDRNFTQTKTLHLLDRTSLNFIRTKAKKKGLSSSKQCICENVYYDSESMY